MNQACRDALTTVEINKAAHAGLLLDSFLREQRSPEMRKGLLDAARSAANNAKDLYNKAYTRWRASLDLPQVVKAQLKTETRLICGLGIECILETGLRLHHTYGTPIVPGSSIKGVCAHYCNDVWGAADPRFLAEGESYKTLFGIQEDKGMLTWHDAWILPATLNNSLVDDVMNPHYSAYYGGGQAAPTDSADPIPVSFLSVRGTFLIAIECEDSGPKGVEWANLAMTLSKAALADWGVGGKTRAGYGRLVAT